MYNVGNVKRKIEAKFKDIKDIYVNIWEKFVYIYVKEDKIWLAEIKKGNSENIWELAHLDYVQKQDKDDEFFYQEALYKFYQEIVDETNKCDKLCVEIANDNQMINKLQYEFPQMPKKDLRKALYWELLENENIDKYYYNYRVNDKNIKEQDNLMAENICDIEVNLIDKDLVDFWRVIAKEQNLKVCSIYTTSNTFILDNIIKNSEFNKEQNKLTYELNNTMIVLNLDNEWVENEFKEEINYLVARIMQLLTRQYIELLPKKYQETIWKWKNIGYVLAVVLMMIICFWGSFMGTNHYQLQNKENILAEQLNLLEQDIKQMESLKIKEQIIQDKQSLVKILSEKSLNSYAILVNLGTNTIQDVKLINVEINEMKNKNENNNSNSNRNIVTLVGKAKSYEGITNYEEQLKHIDLFDEHELLYIKLNPEDNLLDFSIKLK